MRFKVVKQTTVGSGWGSRPDGRSVGAMGCVEASFRGSCGAGCVAAHGFKRSPTLLSSNSVHFPTSAFHSIPIPGPQASGAGSTGVIPSAAGFWISSLWNPQPEPATPDLFFTPFPQQSHAIHVCLHVQQRQGYRYMCMRCFYSPDRTYSAEISLKSPS